MINVNRFFFPPVSHATPSRNSFADIALAVFPNRTQMRFRGQEYCRHLPYFDEMLLPEFISGMSFSVSPFSFLHIRANILQEPDTVIEKLCTHSGDWYKVAL